DYYIPDRQADGYGVNPRVVERLRREGAGLLITVDCGVSAHEGLERARQLGMEVIVTDHHLLPDRLPEAYAILHPEVGVGGRRLEATASSLNPRASYGSPLSGAGMAFKLAQALIEGKSGVRSQESGVDSLSTLFDLVALGTIADMVPLVGENRFLVRKGLDLLSAPTLRRGLAALKAVAGIEGKRVGVGQVHFQIAPRINAPGRVAQGGEAVRLLTTRDPEVAYRLARRLDELNRERQAIEEVVLEEARGEALRLYREGAPQVLVLGSPRWHPGVIGIVAARLAEEFYRPAVLIALKDGLGKGSARSIPGFHLYEAIHACGDLLEGYGGHRYAAGLTVRTEQIESLRRRLDRLAEERLSSEDLRPTVTVDAEAAPADLRFDLVKQIQALGPYGVGNPEPVLAFRDVEVVQSRVVGQGHLKLRVKASSQRSAVSGQAVEAIGFKMGDRLSHAAGVGARCHLACVPQLQEWQGTYGVQIQIRDLRSAKEPLFN
ncbi:MAG: single-stranded-DNA-specific exonuclease RecJ, partial [Nitrospirae bacterium]|nr:single-stranded-DNA-specific exonuclease RecJ [Nitrospirota bacterium]